MKHFTFTLLLSLFALTVYGTDWTITTPGFNFSPDNITIVEGDNVMFAIAGSHNAVEVSEATWNANGSTPLAGGFSLGFGGGTVPVNLLTPGTHYYVCQPHSGMGMKGIIIVETISSTKFQPYRGEIMLYPNPTKGSLNIEMPAASLNEQIGIEVLALTGEKVFSQNQLDASTVMQVNLHHLPAGLYILNIHTSEGRKARKIYIE